MLNVQDAMQLRLFSPTLRGQSNVMVAEQFCALQQVEKRDLQKVAPSGGKSSVNFNFAK